MLTPRLTDLLESFVVTRAATHPVNILRNKRMVVVRQGKPINVDRPFITCIGSQRDPHAAVDSTTVQLRQADQLANNHVGARDSPWQRLVKCWKFRRFHIAVLVELYDLDWLHGGADGDFASNRAGVRRAAKRLGEFFGE